MRYARSASLNQTVPRLAGHAIAMLSLGLNQLQRNFACTLQVHVQHMWAWQCSTDSEQLFDHTWHPCKYHQQLLSLVHSCSASMVSPGQHVKLMGDSPASQLSSGGLLPMGQSACIPHSAARVTAMQSLSEAQVLVTCSKGQAQAAAGADTRTSNGPLQP